MRDGKTTLTDDELFVIEVMKCIRAEQDIIIGTMLLLNQDKKRKMENVKKLINYIIFKGECVTPQDILEKTVQITISREQYYPFEMYVRYIGNSAELFNNEIYNVKKVFGDNETYVIKCEDNVYQEVSSKLFEVQKVTKVLYTGSKNDDGTINISKGFNVGKTYNVLYLKNGEYSCDNGQKCMVYEAEPVEFEKAEPRLPLPFDSIDHALRMITSAFEFGRISELSTHLLPGCNYISKPAAKEFHTKKEIVKHLREVSHSQLSKDIFIDCVLATVTESKENDKFSAGTRCVVMNKENECINVVFVTLSGDNRFITEINILDEPYKVRLDD